MKKVISVFILTAMLCFTFHISAKADFTECRGDFDDCMENVHDQYIANPGSYDFLAGMAFCRSSLRACLALADIK
jgi:hypothetical protein